MPLTRSSIRNFVHTVERVTAPRNAVIVLGIALACWPYVFALDPALDVNQYAHTVWKIDEGFAKGAIRSLAQTTDGYLWLGTEFGLFRFDGVRAIPWQPSAGERLPSSDIRSLRGARDGRLWIGTFTGLASWKYGKLTHYPELDGQVIEALLEDREGTMWVAGWAPSVGRLCRIQDSKTQCYGENGRFGSGVTSLYEDSGGNLWLGAMNGLWRWKPGPPRLYPMPQPAQKIYAINESDDGGILTAKLGQITKLKNEKPQAYPLPAGQEFQPFRMLRDRDGGLWIGAVVDGALLHIHQGRTDLFTRADGLSSNDVTSLFEDREGNIWVATGAGLERFRDFAIPTVSVRQGLSSQGVFSILAAKDGSLWLGTSVGLDRWNRGQITVYHTRGAAHVRPTVGGLAAGKRVHFRGTVRELNDSGLPAESLFEDYRGRIWVGTQGGVAFLESERFVPVVAVPNGVVFGFAGDSAGNVWMSHQEGLFHLLGARVVERIPWSRLGRAEPASALLHDAVQGVLWLGFRDGGVAYFKDGQIRASYTGAQGLGAGMVRGLYLDGKDTLWASTDGGLSGIKDGRILTLTSRSGLPCDTVHWMTEDDAHSVWLYLTCGLVRIVSSELDAWASHPKQIIRTTVFGSSEGVTNHQFTGGYNAVIAKSADGKLWFLRGGGVSVVDPRHLPVNKLPPPVHIEQVIADSKTYDATKGLRLPPHVRNLAIDYTALSLVAPEKVRFRFKLDGMDRDWREVVNDRQVQYSNVGPGTYWFRVKACNNSGVWNEEGATLEFMIAPAWYQTNWFRAACVAAFLAMIWGIYELRVRQLAAQFNMRLEERVAERTRVARDLHDTLLQSFQALLPSLQAGINMLAARPADARKVLEDTADHASQAIAEGRDAVQGLRMSTVEKNDLAVAIRTVGEELASAASTQPSPNFNVVVEGASRNLHPILRDEVYRLAVEALRNAFRHAAAQNVEVEIRYDEKYFRLRIRDDGKGIPSDVLSGDGREGHYGLPGMRERAKLVGGKLAIWTELDGGTEIELNIPGARAYVTSTRTFWHFGKRSATDTDEKEPIERE
jgi:signal transduction histidine kinase/ligand-binding sensor domain-containing protein